MVNGERNGQQGGEMQMGTAIEQICMQQKKQRNKEDTLKMRKMKNMKSQQ